MGVYEDELPDLKPGEMQSHQVDGHTFKITATSDTGFNSGRRCYRVECVSCEILVHPGSTSADAQIRYHLRNPTDRFPE